MFDIATRNTRCAVAGSNFASCCIALLMIEGLRQWRIETKRGIGRHHAVWRAHEQRVFEEIAQAAKRVAQRGLRETQKIPGGGEAAQVPDGKEHAQQVQIGDAEIRLVHALLSRTKAYRVTRDGRSVCREINVSAAHCKMWSRTAVGRQRVEVAPHRVPHGGSECVGKRAQIVENDFVALHG
jgi:hypothetical protein